MSTAFTPLFSGGSGRSGTTIIVNLLKSHPEIHSSLPREIKYLTSRYGLVDLNFGRSIKLEEDIKGIKNNLAASINNRIGKRKEDIFLSSLKSKWWSEVGKKGKPRGLVQGVTEEQLAEISSRFHSSYEKDRLVASRELFYNLSSCQCEAPETKVVPYPCRVHHRSVERRIRRWQKRSNSIYCSHYCADILI